MAYDERDVIDLIHLADRPGTSGHSVAVRVLGRQQPSGRTPSMRFKPDESGGLWVSVHDGPSSAVTLTVPLFSPAPGWIGEQHALLSRVREVYPREVVETSSGAYEWRRGRD
ncbi:DUF5959 family protein [Streptomyces sp. R35]|uniref:DUF5959 family protein n=1 Tax=Streptomyces sp. R35 TaxID=3238630 RepID=A0AB39SDW6_9ACTN